MVRKKAITTVAFFVLMQSAASFANDLPEGVLQEGSLTNEKLMSDAMVGVASKVAVKGCASPETFLPYVTRMPEGPRGKQVWAEKWVVSGCDREFPIDVEFREDGPNAASWVVR